MKRRNIKMEQVLEFINKYGTVPALTGLVVIFLIGCIKLIFKKPLEKIDKANRKPIYEVLSLVFSYGLAALWILVRTKWFGIAGDPFSWNGVVITGSSVYVAVKVMYPLYENLRLRDLVQLIGKAFVNLFKKKKKAEVNEDNNNNGPIVL